MLLDTLHLVNFKSYTNRRFDFSPRLNCLTGLNGVGKTNVLDAVYYLGLTKSHRNVSDRLLVHHEADFFRLDGQFKVENTAQRVVVKFAPGKIKEVACNDVPYPRLADHIGQFPVVMIAPDDISLIQEGSEERRRFLDTTLSQLSAEYLTALVHYNHLLRQRNAQLKAFGEQRRFDATLLEVYNAQMAGPARVIYAQREAFAAAFRPVFDAMYSAISDGREVANFRYEADQQKGELSQLLIDSQERDRVLERTNVGPHRDDLDLYIGGQPVKKFASQGQIKSFLLALRLAQYEMLRAQRTRTPILLLDDIFDKLDARRVQQLLQLLIKRQFGQVFITDTQSNRIGALLEAVGSDYQMLAL